MRRVLVVFAVVLAAVLVMNGFGRAGYCFGEGRWVSDGEKMEAAIGLALGGGNARRRVYPSRPGDTEMEFRTPAYASGAEFLAAHPGCCRIGVDTVPDWGPITRGDAGITTVVVDFQVRGQSRDGSERPITVRTTVAVDECGRRSDNFAFFRVGRTTWHD